MTMRYEPDHKQHTRELVLAEAAKAIRSQGPDRVAVAGVMKRAGLTHGGFYSHFASKDAMLAATIEYMFDGSRDRWVHKTLDRPPAQALGTYIDWYLSAAHRDSKEHGCPIAALAADLPRLSSPCRAAFASGTRKLMAKLTELIAAAGHDDAPELARSVLAELVGALSLARVDPDHRRSDAVLATSRRAIKARLGLGGRS